MFIRLVSLCLFYAVHSLQTPRIETHHITSTLYVAALRHGSVVFILNTSRLLLSHFRQWNKGCTTNSCPTKWRWNHMKSLQDPKSFLFKVSHWLLSQPYGAKEMNTTLFCDYTLSSMQASCEVQFESEDPANDLRILIDSVIFMINPMKWTIMPCLVAWLGTSTWEFQGSKPPVPPAINSHTAAPVPSWQRFAPRNERFPVVVATPVEIFVWSFDCFGSGRTHPSLRMHL